MLLGGEGETQFERRGLLLVLSSPSGAGKTTLTRILLEDERDIVPSISVTTRQRRRSEVEGRHYHFIDDKRFEKMVADGELLENAIVHGNRYGTPREPVEQALAAGRDVIFDIDWQGAQQRARQAPDDMVSVFLLPPSMDELKARLERRAEDDHGTIAKRLEAAREEIGHWPEYDYVIVNDDLDKTLGEVKAILRAERIKRVRQPRLSGFVEQLLG